MGKKQVGFDFEESLLVHDPVFVVLLLEVRFNQGSVGRLMGGVGIGKEMLKRKKGKEGRKKLFIRGLHFDPRPNIYVPIIYHMTTPLSLLP